MRLVSTLTLGCAVVLAGCSATPVETGDPDAEYYEAAWEARVTRAYADDVCATAGPRDYPAGWYRGDLIDTHLHMPQLSDRPLGFEPGEREIPDSLTRGTATATTSTGRASPTRCPSPAPTSR